MRVAGASIRVASVYDSSSTIGAEPSVIYITVPTPNILAVDVLVIGIFDWYLVPASNPAPPFRSFPHFFTPQGSIEQNRTVNEGDPPASLSPAKSLWLVMWEAGWTVEKGWVNVAKRKVAGPCKEWSPDSRHEAHILCTMLMYIRRNYPLRIRHIWCTLYC